ncbi:MAG: DUF1932 domain-containing protein [Sphingomicrobium sp.]
MAERSAIIGFGEAAQAFVGAERWALPVRAYDRLTDEPATRASKLADYARLNVEAADRLAGAIDGAGLILSLVTADQALAVATAATTLPSGSIYCDMNSVAPATKIAAAAAVEGRSGRYVDVAIMSPVNPARLNVPLLLSGPAAIEAELKLRAAGFCNCRVIGNRVGQAAAVKMIRSVIVKGIEALTAEAMLAAELADVTQEVLASLDATERAVPWAERADYNLERMMLHGIRRAEEMNQAVRTLEALGIEPLLTRVTAQRQREMGLKRVHPLPGLGAKLAQLRSAKAVAA